MTVTDREAFLHLIDVVLLEPDEDKPIKKCLVHEGIADWRDLIALSSIDTGDLTIPSGRTSKELLGRGYRNKLSFLRQYLFHLNNIHILNLDSDDINDRLMEITKSDFDTYRLDPTVDAESTSSHHSTPPSTTPTAPVRDPLSSFKQTIKKDKTQYPFFKDEKYWDQWNQSFSITAKSHDLAEILDPDYVPTTDAEQKLFKAKQSFAYSVLHYTLLTDMGKTLVRQHYDQLDAQKVYKELCAYHANSTKAKLNASELLTYITTVRFDSSWKGTAQSFLLHWKNQLRLLDDLQPTEDQFSLPLRKAMLENAVHAVEELRSVKVLEDHNVTMGKEALGYEEYFNLLHSAASRFDSKNGHKRKFKVQQVHQHSYSNPYDSFQRPDFSDTLETTFDDTFDPSHPTQTVCNIDMSPSDFLAANMARGLPPSGPSGRGEIRRPQDSNRPYLPPELWDKMSKSAQMWWMRNPLMDKPQRKSPHNKYKANVHDVDIKYESGTEEDKSTIDEGDNEDEETSDEIETDVEPGHLMAFMNKQKSLEPGDIRKILASAQSTAGYKEKKGFRKKKPSVHQEVLVHKGKKYMQINSLTYSLSKHVAAKHASLVDRGANGGLAGEDVRVLNTTMRKVDISGIDNHQVKGLDIVTAAGVIETQHGPCIAILNQYAHLGKGKTIHSSGQLEFHKNQVDDRSKKVGGKQCIVTLDGYIIPLQVKNGLPYLDMHPPTDDELENLPHVVFTSDVDWDPAVLDCDFDLDNNWTDVPQLDDLYDNMAFDEFGNFKNRHISTLESGASFVKEKPPDLEPLRPKFGWAPLDVIAKTLQATTQFARLDHRIPMRHHFKSRFPALNVHRRNEPVATDTIYSDTPDIESGSKIAQFFVGRNSLVCDAYGIKSEKEFVNTLEDNIRFRGAMDKLISDRAQVEISKKVKDILRNYCIEDWQSEPHHQQQNFAERKYQVVKSYVNNIMNRTGAWPGLWLLCLKYVCFLLNHLATATLQWRTPMEVLHGSTPDVSPLMKFHFWEPVYYLIDDKQSFPSETHEKLGRFVGISENVGDTMTFKVLSDDTEKILHRSSLRSATSDKDKNKRLEPESDPSDPIVFVKSTNDCLDPALRGMSGYSPDDLIGRTFIKEVGDEKFRAKIKRKIVAPSDEPGKEEDISFLVESENGNFDEIISYNDILGYLEKLATNDLGNEGDFFKFRDITAHQGPLTPRDPEWRGSKYNVLVEWETGETTYEPLNAIATDDPVTCALYAKRNGLLDTPGWKQFKRLAKREKVLIRMLKQTKLHQVNRSPIYMFGYRVPRNHQEAVQIDAENGNTKWVDAEKLELSQLDDYNTFQDNGKAIFGSNGHILNAPAGHKKIRVHFVYAVKHDGRHKARLVAGGHLTDIPLDSVYSGVVSLRSLRLVIFLAELNGLQIWQGDIGNAYLEAMTKEKLFIVAGPEFGEREGHILVIFKALYGLRTSGLRWHERFADTMRDMGFFPCRGDGDVWMRLNKEDDLYEYVAVYVDDLCIAMKDPAGFIKELKQVHKYKIKGDGPIEYHLGCDYERAPTGEMTCSPRKYIEKSLDAFDKMFGHLPREYSSPLEKNDHPEIDESPELDTIGIKKYQSLIGTLQWLVSLGRFDIATAVMTMSRFRAAPRQGHLDRLMRIFGYVKKFRHAKLRFLVDAPDYSDLPDQDHDWMYTVYGKVKEIVPSHFPAPKGKDVVLSTYVDANLYHDLVTGRSVTGILHLINKTPFDWFTKRQSTVETATYGSEFVAARIGVDQIIDIRDTLRCFGVPIRHKTIMFGDNQSVITSSTLPHSKLSKRHNALSYHRVREAVASGILGFYKIDGAKNPADILSKHCGFPQAWPLLKPLLFCEQDEMLDCPDSEDDIADSSMVKAVWLQLHHMIIGRTIGEC